MKLKKTLLIIFGIILSLAILETGLRFASWIAQSYLSKDSFTKNGKIKILCLGDSYTYGLGVERTQAYPAQLEALLKSKLGNDKLEVINAGRPGLNTPLLAGKFNVLLDNYHPDMVLVMIGTNDEWNFSGFRPNTNPIIEKISSFVFSLRITRMFKILATAFKHPENISCFEVQVDKTKISKMIKLIEENGGLNTAYYYQAVLLGNECRDKNMFDEAKLYYDCALKINPDGKLISLELRRYYKKALTVLRDGLKKDNISGLLKQVEQEGGIDKAYYNDLMKPNISKFIHSIYLNKEELEDDNKFALEMIDLSKIVRILSLFEDNLLLSAKTIYLYGFSVEIWEELDELFIAWPYPENAIKFYQNLLEKYPDNIDIYSRLVSQYKRVWDYKQVAKYCEKILKINPDNQPVIDNLKMANEFIDQGLTKDYILRDINSKLFAQINSVLDGGNTKFPAGGQANNIVKDPGIALSIYIKEKRYDQEIEKILSQDKNYAKLFGKKVLNHDVFVKQRLAKIHNIVADNLKQMCAIAKQRKTKILFLSYPLVVYETVQDTAKTEGIPFIDFRESFLAILNPDNFKDYFLADGHCTEKGYKIVANKVAEVILSELLN